MILKLDFYHSNFSLMIITNRGHKSRKIMDEYDEEYEDATNQVLASP